MNRLFCMVILLVCLEVQLTVAQTIDASPYFEMRKIKVSKNLDDFFVGFFTPVTPESGHNFLTCGGSTRLVALDAVRDPEFEIACEAVRNPLSLLTSNQFFEQAIGQAVSNLDGKTIGRVGAITVNEKGAISSYIISTSDNSFAIASGNDVSGWSTGSNLAFLAFKDPIDIPGSLYLNGNWLTSDVERAISVLNNKVEKVYDLKVVKDTSTVGPFTNFGVVPAEAWLSLK